MKTPIAPIRPSSPSQSKTGIDDAHASSPVFCKDHTGQTFTFDAFLEKVRAFHGHTAPGLVLGGRMVTAAMDALPPGILFDAVCETGNCLPDAVQILTPCTTGNGWMRVAPLGRFALSLYDKTNGNGVRVFMDSRKLEDFSEIKTWFLKLKPKSEQSLDVLLNEIRAAGDAVFTLENVVIRPDFLDNPGLGEKRQCPLCREFYPARHGALCRGCQSQSPYKEESSCPSGHARSEGRAPGQGQGAPRPS